MLENLGTGFWNIINIITGTIDWIIFFLLIHLVGKRKISNKINLLMIFFILLFMCFINISDLFANIKIVICMILGTLYYKLSCKDKIHKCILITLIFWLGIMITEAISVSLVASLNNLNNIQIIIDNSIYRLEAVIISKVLLFLEIIIFKYFKLSLEFKPKDMILIGIPIGANILSLLIIFEYNLKNSMSNRLNIVILIIITFFLVLSSIILLVIISKIIKDDKIKLEYELINERINTNYKSYENIYEIHNNVRYIYHDLKNHMICMRNYNTREEIVEYIDNLNLQINDFEYFKNTGNKTLDIVLSEKKYICSKYNIQYEEYINISKLDFISNVDICAIFSNALDNAIEACINIDTNIEKRIDVKVTYINQFCILKFTNSKSNEIKFVNQNIQTNKNDKSVHGIGLASIKYIVKKYDGEVIIDYSNDEFILKIMIPIKN